jgi:hypothetical protein
MTTSAGDLSFKMVSDLEDCHCLLGIGCDLITVTLLVLEFFLLDSVVALVALVVELVVALVVVVVIVIVDWANNCIGKRYNIPCVTIS